MEGRERTIFLLLEARAALGFALPPWGLEAPWCLQDEPGGPQQSGSLPQVSGFCLLPKQRGLPSTAHHLPLGCMPTEHAWLRMKACTVCTHLAWPLTSAPGQSEAAEGGRNLLLLLVLLLCNSSPLWPAPYWAYREAPLA